MPRLPAMSIDEMVRAAREAERAAEEEALRAAAELLQPRHRSPFWLSDLPLAVDHTVPEEDEEEDGDVMSSDDSSSVYTRERERDDGKRDDASSLSSTLT